MNSTQPNNYRRRRLRAIQAADERLAQRANSAQSSSTIPLNNSATRQELNQIRKRFFNECRGNPAAVLQLESHGESPIQIAMDRPFLVIGRDPSCDLPLNDAAVSPHHGYLQWINGHLFYCDLTQRSRFLPDQNPTSTSLWVDRRPISIGSYQMRLLDETLSPLPDYSPLDRSPSLAIELPQLGLEFEGIEQIEKIFPVNRTLTLIGRGPQCKLRMNHKTIRDVQACLIRTPRSCWLVDLVNDGTTEINGQLVRVSPIDAGDVIRLGSFSITVITTNFEPVLPFEKTVEDSPNDQTGGAKESIAEFILQQKSQLDALKVQLTTLKQVYDHAAGNMISRKTKALLEKPVIETMQSYEAMEESLRKFMQAHGTNR